MSASFTVQDRLHSAPRDRRHFWLVVALAVNLPLLFTLCGAMWRAPFPINETARLMELAGILRPPTPHVGIDPVIRNIFNPEARNWYRPLFHMTFYSFWHLTNSVDRVLLLFRLVEVTATAASIVLLLVVLRPRSAVECAAATVAVSILVGMPSFRENLELPLLWTLVAIPITLTVWWLCERPSRWWHGPAIVLLLIVAVGYKEQGLVLLPVILGAWLTGAPGVRRGTALTSLVCVLLYLVFRFNTTTAWQPFEQDVGIGFERWSRTDMVARFGTFPYPVYAYNALATIANVLFNEPTDGVFTITHDWLAGTWQGWQLLYLGSSTALTGLVGWWAWRTWRAERGKAWTPELRLIAGSLLALAASGALGFNYTRDRLGGMAAVFMALCGYQALRACLPLLSTGSRQRLLQGAVVLAVFCSAWQLRAVGTVHSIWVHGGTVTREWMADMHQLRRKSADDRVYLAILESMLDQGTNPAVIPPVPPYPDWVRRLLGPS